MLNYNGMVKFGATDFFLKDWSGISFKNLVTGRGLVRESHRRKI